MVIQIPLRWSQFLAFLAGFLVAGAVLHPVNAQPSQTLVNTIDSLRLVRIEQLVRELYEHSPWIRHTPPAGQRPRMVEMER